MRAELLGTGGRLDFLCLSGLSGGRAGPSGGPGLAVSESGVPPARAAGVRVGI